MKLTENIEEMNPYQIVPLIGLSFLQKLFKQRVDTNAVREVNNLLATTPIHQISKYMINEIEKKYDIDLNEGFGLNMEEFYAVYLNHTIGRQQLSYTDDNLLYHLQYILRLNEIVTHTLHEKVGVLWYEKMVSKCVSNGRFSAEEQKLLSEFARNLRLPEKLAESISLTVRKKFIEELLNPIFHRKRLSHEEKARINNTAKSLDINISTIDNIEQQLALFSEYWSLEHEPLPVIDVGEVLAKKEICYFRSSNVRWYETRSIGRGLQQLKLIETGTLYLTDRRILFVYHDRSFNIKLDRILKVVQTDNGFEVQKSAGKNPVLKLDRKNDVAFLIVTRLVKEAIVI